MVVTKSNTTNATSNNLYITLSRCDLDEGKSRDTQIPGIGTVGQPFCTLRHPRFAGC